MTRVFVRNSSIVPSKARTAECVLWMPNLEHALVAFGCASPPSVVLWSLPSVVLFTFIRALVVAFRHALVVCARSKLLRHPEALWKVRSSRWRTVN